MGLVWNPAKFATGVELIDEQHRELFAIANRLLDAAAARRPDAEVGALLDTLGQAAVRHFSCEEDLMDQRKCSTCVSNRWAHRMFLRDFEELRDSFARDGVTAALVDEIEDNVCAWFEAHLLAIDLSLRQTAGA